MMIGSAAWHSFQSTRTRAKKSGLGSGPEKIDANATVDDQQRKWTVSHIASASAGQRTYRADGPLMRVDKCLQTVHFW